jgi:4-diphosphocytidyl-2-C-methyl-D-erythritol kinase
MIFKGECSIKINLTLRVLSKREDGYHDIHSLFWRRLSPEVLEIRGWADFDRLLVDGADIPGENLITRACRYLRSRYKDKLLPPLDMRLVKHLPMGSGVGAGSGNAAALLRWFFDEHAPGDHGSVSEVASIGADVAFLASDYDLALAGGIGEKLECLDGPSGGLDLPAVIMFPEWRNDTAEAFASLDGSREAGSEKLSPLSATDARKESLAVLRGLKERKRLGLLPNDFIACDPRHGERYGVLYGIMEKAGALAWGLCGSGSSCFALFDDRDGKDAISRLMRYIKPEGSSRFSWLHKTLVLE